MVSWGRPRALLGCSWALSGSSWGTLGTLLGLSWLVLGPSYGLKSPSEAKRRNAPSVFGPCWPLGGVLGGLGNRLGAVLSPLGCLSGAT
eukprot:3468220-Pyramimonas_sp.AAC.1